MFVERLNSKQNVFAAPELREKCAAKSEVFTSLPQMTSHKPLFAKISYINIFPITQYFWVKSYKRNQWNLPNMLAYISGIFDDFFKAGLVRLALKMPLKIDCNGSNSVQFCPALGFAFGEGFANRVRPTTYASSENPVNTMGLPRSSELAPYSSAWRWRGDRASLSRGWQWPRRSIGHRTAGRVWPLTGTLLA